MGVVWERRRRRVRDWRVLKVGANWSMHGCFFEQDDDSEKLFDEFDI